MYALALNLPVITHRILGQDAGLCDIYFPFTGLFQSIWTSGPELEVYCCRIQAPDPKYPMLKWRPAISPQKGTPNKVELEKC